MVSRGKPHSVFANRINFSWRYFCLTSSAGSHSGIRRFGQEGPPSNRGLRNDPTISPFRGLNGNFEGSNGFRQLGFAAAGRMPFPNYPIAYRDSYNTHKMSGDT